MTLPDAAVEAVAKALWNHAQRGQWQTTPWEEIPDHWRPEKLDQATAAIAALTALGYAKRADVGEEIAAAIEAQCGQCEREDPTIAAECEYADAAKIAREIGSKP